MSPSTRTPLVVAGLVAALGLGVGAGATAYAMFSDDSTTVVREVTVSSPRSSTTAEGVTIGTIYERSFKGVVEITATGTASDSFGSEQQRRAQGSGFMYGREGNIVTNQHVVEGAQSISVTLWDGSTYDAVVVGSDPSTDLAVIRIDAPASALEPLALGDSSEVGVGDSVVAIGSPFGLEGTVTSGIVSALHREMTAPNNFTITDSIQTDAAINHGNSGGPLLNDQGLVIGVNAQIESDSGGNDGVGFAIPSSTVRSIVSQLLETGQVEHAYLGVTLVTVPVGVALAEVKTGTPADDAGLQAATGTETVNGQEIPTGGDVIIAFEGKEMTSSAELQSAVDARRPGDKVSITILRDGKRRTIEVTLGVRPS